MCDLIDKINVSYVLGYSDNIWVNQDRDNLHLYNILTPV